MGDKNFPLPSFTVALFDSLILDRCIAASMLKTLLAISLFAASIEAHGNAVFDQHHVCGHGDWMIFNDKCYMMAGEGDFIDGVQTCSYHGASQVMLDRAMMELIWEMAGDLGGEFDDHFEGTESCDDCGGDGPPVFEMPSIWTGLIDYYYPGYWVYYRTLNAKVNEHFHMPEAEEHKHCIVQTTEDGYHWNMTAVDCHEDWHTTICMKKLSCEHANKKPNHPNLNHDNSWRPNLQEDHHHEHNRTINARTFFRRY